MKVVLLSSSSEKLLSMQHFDNILCGLQADRLRTDSKAAGNKGFAIAGVPCFAETFVQGGSSVLRMKFSANKPAIANPRNVRCNHNETTVQQSTKTFGDTE